MPFDISNPTLVDAVVVVLIGLYVLEDLRNGILFGLVQLLGLLLSLLAALLFYPTVANLLVEHLGVAYGLAKPIGFGATWLIADLLYGMTVRQLTASASRDVARSTVGRFLGIFTGAARGAIVATLLLAMVSALPVPEPITQAVQESQLGSRLAARGEAVQRALGGVLGDAVQESLALLTVRPESNERVNLSFRVAEPRIDADTEVQMLEMVNRERAANGLGALVMDETIRQVARGYSTRMFQDGFFAHVDPAGKTPFDRMRVGGASFGAAGENLALAPTLRIAHDGLMNSPGHRANILNPRYKRVGIGVADGGMHGKMFVQNFAD